jgi:hypothetical protein
VDVARIEDEMKERLCDQAVAVLDCLCGHPESDHQWQARAESANGIMRTAQCAHAEILPRRDMDQANVEREWCPCSEYKPDPKDGIERNKLGYQVHFPHIGVRLADDFGSEAWARREEAYLKEHPEIMDEIRAQLLEENDDDEEDT